MSGFDIVIGFIVVLFVVIGTWRGFVREVMSLVTWILACVVGWFFADTISGWFGDLIHDQALQLVAGFLALFIIVYIIGTIAGFVAHKLISTKQALKISNHVLGACTGIARGVVMLVIVFLLAGLTTIPQRDWWRGSFFAPYFQSLALAASRFLPSDIARHIRYG